MTLKQSQGHQTYHGNIDPKQGYHHENFENLVLMVSEKKPMLKVLLLLFFIRKYVNYLP